jgi:DNA-binding CsgD family transcriptional regulator
LGTIDEFEPGFLMDLVGQVYEAAIDPERWGEFLAVLERIYPDSRITLFGHENGRPSEALRHYRNFAADDLRAYVEHYVRTSPYIARGSRLAVGQASHYEVMIDDAELKRTEHYNEYVRPRRLGHYGTGVVLERNPRRAVALSLADHRNDADRRARQLRLIQILTPHLIKALRLHHLVAAEKQKGDAARAAFDRWAHAALVLASCGRVVTMNRTAELLLQRPDGLWLGRDGRLQSADDAKTMEIESAVRRCAAIATSAEPASSSGDLDGIVLPRLSGTAPLRVMLSPLPFLGGESTWDIDGGMVLMVLFDPDNIRRTPIDWIARQFGLTPSEQRLAEAIVNGLPLAEAAAQLGIRETTARTRLKVIQTKTDCRRQSDLVRLALSLPAVRQE